MNRAILDYTSIVMGVVAIAITLASCGQPKSTVFDVWYEAVINEPYDPMNGSKY